MLNSEVKHKDEYKYKGFQIEHLLAFLKHHGKEKYVPDPIHVKKYSRQWLLNGRLPPFSRVDRFSTIVCRTVLPEQFAGYKEDLLNKRQ